MEKAIRIYIKKRSYDSTLQGGKREQYFPINFEWARRFYDVPGLDWEQWKVVTSFLKGSDYKNFICGYPLKKYKKAILITELMGKYHKRIDVEVKSIRVGEGKVEWGAKPGRLYFVLEHGDKIALV